MWRTPKVTLECVGSIFHCTTHLDAHPTPLKPELGAARIDQTACDLDDAGSIEPGGDVSRGKRQEDIRRPLGQLAHWNARPVANVLAIPGVTAELETLNLEERRVQVQQGLETTGDSLAVDIAFRIVRNVIV